MVAKKPWRWVDLAGRERQRAHGAAVEAAEEADEVRPPGVIAGQLDGRLDRLGARVGHEADRGFLERGDLVQLLGQVDPYLVIEVGRDVDELVGLLLDGLHHLGMGVAGGGDGDAGGEVEEAIAVHVQHFGAAAVRP